MKKMTAATAGDASSTARGVEISLMTCLQVLIWFSMIARGRALGLVVGDEIPVGQGILNPSVIRLMVSRTRTRLTVFRLMVTKNNFVSRNSGSISVKICLLFTLVKTCLYLRIKNTLQRAVGPDRGEKRGYFMSLA